MQHRTNSGHITSSLLGNHDLSIPFSRATPILSSPQVGVEEDEMCAGWVEVGVGRGIRRERCLSELPEVFFRQCLSQEEGMDREEEDTSCYSAAEHVEVPEASASGGQSDLEEEEEEPVPRHLSPVPTHYEVPLQLDPRRGAGGDSSHEGGAGGGFTTDLVSGEAAHVQSSLPAATALSQASPTASSPMPPWASYAVRARQPRHL